MWKNVGTLKDFLEYLLVLQIGCESIYEALLDHSSLCKVEIFWRFNTLVVVVVDDVLVVLFLVTREQEWILVLLLVIVVAVTTDDNDSIHSIAFCTNPAEDHSFFQTDDGKSRLSMYSRSACQQTDRQTTDRRQTSTKCIPLDRYVKEIALIDAFAPCMPTDRQTDDKQTTDVNKTRTVDEILVVVVEE